MTAIRFGNMQAKGRLAELALNGTFTDIDFATARTMAIEAELQDYPEGLLQLAIALRDGANGAPRDVAEAGRIARVGLSRTELRPLSYTGAYPMNRLYFARILQAALRQGALAQHPSDELSRLDGRYGTGPVLKRFTVPMDCGATQTPTFIYIWDAPNAPPPADLQFQWYRLRGCEMAPDVQHSFTRLFYIARENGVSYAELSMRALSNQQE